MQKITIGKMAHMLNLEKKQVRQWAHEFNINTVEQQLFGSEELVKFKLIKKLIFHENYTLEQVKKYFSDHEQNSTIEQITQTDIKLSASPVAELFDTLRHHVIVRTPVAKITLKQLIRKKTELTMPLTQNLRELQKQLIRLKELL